MQLKRRGAALAGAAALALLALPGAAHAAVQSAVVDGVLTVESNAGDAITITCDTDQVKINGGNPDVGGPAACSTLTGIQVIGGPDANAITLTGVTATAFPALADVQIDGAGGNDTIAGSEKVDVMRGGDGNDRILGDDNAAGTRDQFLGQAGDDTLVWNPGDDDDLMEGGDGADTIEVNGGGGPEQFAVKPSAGRVQFDRTGPTPPGPFNLDIGTAERLDMNMGGGDDSFTADAGLDALGFALDVAGDAGNDTIDGGDGADLLAGGDGNDAITPDDNPANTRDVARGDAGDDAMIWNGGDDDDVNEGGDGNDTVTVNGAAVPEQFTIKPSATPGRATFDRLTTPPGPFNIDIATSERLDLNLGGGDDSFVADGELAALGLKMDVEGGDGNDTIDGGDDADLLAGGNGNDRILGDDNPAGTRDVANGDAGDDTMVWNPGDDDDVNEGGEGNDVAEVNGGTGGEQFQVKPSAVAGRVSFDRTGPTPPGPFNVDIGTTERLLLNASGGDDRIRGAKGLAKLIASTFNGDDGHDRISGTDGPDAISGGKGNDLITSIDKARDRIDCGAGLDLGLVDRRDLVRACELVLGGRLRVALAGKPKLRGDDAAMKLRCVASARCVGTAELRRGGKSLGKARYAMKRGKAKAVRVRLNARGERVAAAGKRMKLRLDTRDSDGNGWRTVKRVKLAR